MLVLGIDPGSANTGYGVLRMVAGRMKYLESGVIRPKRTLTFSQKLHTIHEAVVALLARESFDCVAVEDVYQGVNARTAARIGHVRGVVLLAAANAGVVVAEYPPNEIKSAVVGNGLASKEQVQFMVEQILRPAKPMESLDESDAVAVAICACHRNVERLVR